MFLAYHQSFNTPERIRTSVPIGSGLGNRQEIRKNLYRLSDEDSSFYSVKLPILFIRAEKAEIILNLNYQKFIKSFDLPQDSQRKIKKFLGVKDSESITSQNKLKRKLELMLVNGNYKSKKELAKAVGLSDAHVCRVLKHKK
jgi:hypothetical protein